MYGKFGMEEQHVLLDNLGVADEEALRTRCQRTRGLRVGMAARDVAPEVVDVLRRVLAHAAAQGSGPIGPLKVCVWGGQVNKQAYKWCL